MDENRVEELRRKVKEAREAYFNLDPIISDQEYDSMVGELKALNPDDAEVVAVGAPAPVLSVWEKVRHEIPMGSLGKVNSHDEFREWTRGTGTGEFFVTHKIDGSSMEIVYENGLLTRCVTRGDGVTGEDVTVNVSQVPTVPKRVPVKGKLTVRGEIVMFRSEFQEKYASEYANPRNTAAAKVREKKHGGAHCKDLVFLTYWASDHPEKPETFYGMIGWLKRIGFSIPTHHAPGDVDKIREVFGLESLGRGSLPYEIDGMVVSVNDLKKLAELGDHNMRPRGQVAWKFDAEMRETRIRDVVWQVGPTGRICPVAKVDPVNIGGVSITSVSLHNISMFKELGLWPGCRVLVSRRNDVIPYLQENLDRPARQNGPMK